ncbi:hypothetical protein BGZ99_004715 [Dissophora globulifera]|uniref:Spindle pole body component n=1 Tax=Dissophora globulifera TaxID=979702 RepID=A0A9P6RGY9_9FUNG|nr:hypothetical protein BGZ99_004715 [Dissophora globulifera]
MSMSKRQRTPLPGPARELITRVTGFQASQSSLPIRMMLSPNDHYFDACAAYVSLHLFDVAGLGGNRNKSVDRDSVDKRLAGLAEKLSMNSQDTKSDALRSYLLRLRGLARSLGGGDSARMVAASGSSEMHKDEAAHNVVSSVLLVLLELSQSPTALGRRGESVYEMPKTLKEPLTAPKTQEQIDRETLRAILQADPLVGAHWQMNGGDNGDAQDEDNSDFEDMDVNARSVPSLPGTQVAQENSNGLPNDNIGTSIADRPKAFGGLDLWDQRTSSQRFKEAPPLLQALERHQYWRGDAVVSKRRTAQQTGQGAEAFDIQHSWELNSAVHNSQGFVLTTNTPVMEEIDIIHEVFLLLQGLPTVIFEYDEGSPVVKLFPKVAVSHLSSGSLESILQPFLESAREMDELQAVADSVCFEPLSAHGKTIQRFAAATHAELLALRKLLAGRQQEYQRYRKGYGQRMASLIELHANISEDLEAIHVLLAFLKGLQFYKSISNSPEQACSYSTDVLSSLYISVCDLELIGDARNSVLFMRLLQQSIWPLLLNMECWLSGRALDAESEFLIQIAPNVSLFSNGFWADWCYIQSEIVDNAAGGAGSTSTMKVSPCFLRDASLKQLIYTGKAIRVIQALRASEIERAPYAEGFASTVFRKIFRPSNSSHLDASTESATDMNTSFLKYHSVLAHQYPLQPSPFIPLTDVSSTSSALSQEASFTVGSDFKWRMDSELAGAIEEQYLSTNALLKSMFSTQSQLLWHLKGMAEFYFMMQGEVMHSFSTDIFHKMLRRRSWYDSYILGSTFTQVASLRHWKHAKFVTVRTGDQRGALRTGQTHLSGLKIQVLEQIKFEYQVLDVQIKKFHGEIGEQQGDLDDMIRLSQGFINTCYERCFLKERAGPLHRSLMTMLNLALRFSALFSTFIYEREREQAELPSDHLTTRSRLERQRLETRSSMSERQRRRVSFNPAPRGATTTTATFTRGTRDGESSSGDSDDSYDSDGSNSFRKDEAHYGARDNAKWLSSHVGSVSDMKEKSVRQIDAAEDNGNAEVHSDDDGEEGEDVVMSLGSETGARRVKRLRMARHELQGTADSGRPVLHDAGNIMESGQSQSKSGRRSRSGQTSFREQLLAIEQEFDGSREFLAKSLRVVVSSNAARGYHARQRAGGRGGEGGGTTEEGGRGKEAEGDSNYLDVLILALSS